MSSFQENNLFPIFLKLREFETLIVGAGNVGLEKVEALLKNDSQARLSIVAPEIKEELQVLVSEHENIRYQRRKFQWSDLEDKHLVLLASDQPELHQEIRSVCQQRHILINVADTPSLCDFYLGSTVKKGALKIGISTNGQSPTLAKRFRELLEEVIPDDTPELLKNLKEIRDQLKGDFEYKVKTLNEITTQMLKEDE